MTHVWISYLITFVLTFWAFYIVPINFRWIILLIASVCFYVLNAGLPAFYCTLTAALVSFSGALLISRFKENVKIQQRILASSIIFIVIEMVMLSFSDVYAGFANLIHNFTGISIDIAKHVVPVGISFYSLILIAYITDVYRNIVKPQTDFYKFSLFAFFFPTILIGPIIRYNDVKDSLFSKVEVDYNCIKIGIFRILWGIFKKIVIADRIAAAVNPVFENLHSCTGETLCLAIFLFMWQFYIDFSAAMDIVLGISECFGIKLPENFNNPFFAKNFHNFWNRWHITLYAFLKDYIFYPVMRCKIMTCFKEYLEKCSNDWTLKYIPLFISYFVVWSIAAFRHGFSDTNYISIAIIPCALFIIEDICGYIFKHFKVLKTVNINTNFSKLFSFIYVFSFLFINWTFYRTKSIDDTLFIIKQVFTNSNLLQITNINSFLQFFDNKPYDSFIIYKEDFLIITLGILLMFIVDILKENNINLKKIYVNLSYFGRWTAIIILLTLIFLFGLYGQLYNPEDFLYFK